MDVLTTSSTNRSTKQLLLSSCGLCWDYLYNISAPKKEHKRKKTQGNVCFLCLCLSYVGSRTINFVHQILCRDCANPTPWTMKKMEDESLKKSS